MMAENHPKIKSIKNVIIHLFYAFILSSAINPLISYTFKIDNLHLIIVLLVLILIINFLIKNGKVKIDIQDIPVVVYLLVVILGILFGIYLKSPDVKFITQALSYRILFPVLFLLFFMMFDNLDDINHIGYNYIKVINIICIILGLAGLIEKINPIIIHKLYGDSLTSHLVLILNSDKSSRLISLVGNPINFGFYMTIGINSSLALLLINFKKKNIFMFIQILCIPLFMYNMFLTYSRAAILTSLIGGISFIFLLILKSSKKNKIRIFLLSIFIFLLLRKIVFSIDSIAYRINSISLDTFFKNTRYDRAYNAFNKGTNFFQLLWGHGISKINDSNSYVFELGYASLLYESGLVGFIMVIGSYIKGVLLGIKNNNKNNIKNEIYINAFYISIIISGLAGMLVEDLYMQQPYSVFLWFSTFFLVSKHIKSNNQEKFLVIRD